MSLPTDTTSDSLRGEATQDTLSQLLADHHAKSAAHFQAHLARLDALADAVVAGVDDPIACGIGAMGIKAETGEPVQYPDATEEWTGTFRQLADWVLREARFGQKFDPPCVYPAVPKVPQSCKAANYHHSRIVAVDIDHIHSEEQYERVLETCARWACIPFSTFSNNPPFVWRLRIFVLLSHAPRTVEEHRRVSAQICAHLSELTSVEIDVPVTVKAFQPALPPAWKDQAAKDAALLPSLVEGPAYPNGEMLAEIRAAIRAEEEAEEAEDRERKAVELAAAAAGIPTPGSGSGNSEPDARAALARFPIRAGCGERNKRIPVAVGICRDHGLDEAQARRLLLEVYSASVGDDEWIGRWVSTIYSKPHRPRRRPAVTAPLGEFDLGGFAHSAPVTSNLCNSITEPCSDNGAKPPVDPGEAGLQAPSAPTLAALDPWRAKGIAPPAKLTTVHTAALPPLQYEELHQLTCISSPWGTQKTRSLLPLVAQVVEQLLGRIVYVVPNQNLSLSTARLFGIQSHLDPVVDWTKSVVTTYHSLHKVKLSSFERPALYDLDDPEAEIETHHPVHLFVSDEAMELNDVRVGDLVRKAHTCDVNHRRALEIIQSGAKTIALNAFMDSATIRWQQHLQGWFAGTEGADWEFVVNTCLAVAPDLYTGANPRRLRRRIHDAVMAGDPVLVPCSTVPTCEDEARQLAVSVMSARAGFDVRPFLGRAGVKALHPAEKLPKLVAELAKHGKAIEEVRPKILVIDRLRMTEEAQTLLANPELIENYDALFHTASISSGFSITRPMRGFAFFEEGAGPVADQLLQMIFRLRSPIGNAIEICMTGKAPLKSQDPRWWYAKQTRLGSHTDDMIKGLCSYSQTRKDGTTWITDYNEHLMWSLAESNARREAQTHICDTYDDMGRVVADGAFSAMAKARGLRVISVRELEVQEELGISVEQVKAEKAEKKECREAIRDAGDEVVAEAEHITKEEADRLRRRNDRRPETLAKIRSANIRHHYGLEEVTPEDVRFDRKGGFLATTLFAAIEMMKLDRAKAIQRLMENVGPVPVHHRHEALKAAMLLHWCEVIAPGGLEAATKNQTPLRSLGAYLAQRPAERQLLEDLLGFGTTDEDLEGMELTGKVLNLLRLERSHKQARKGKTREWEYRIRTDSWNTMVEKSRPALFRLQDPEKAKEEWAKIELGSKVVDLAAILAGILAVEDFRLAA